MDIPDAAWSWPLGQFDRDGEGIPDDEGLPDIVPAEQARLALERVFEYNVKRFANGQMGAVNGMRPQAIWALEYAYRQSQ